MAKRKIGSPFTCLQKPTELFFVCVFSFQTTRVTVEYFQKLHVQNLWSLRINQVFTHSMRRNCQFSLVTFYLGEQSLTLADPPPLFWSSVPTQEESPAKPIIILWKVRKHSGLRGIEIGIVKRRSKLCWTYCCFSHKKICQGQTTLWNIKGGHANT